MLKHVLNPKINFLQNCAWQLFSENQFKVRYPPIKKQLSRNLTDVTFFRSLQFRLNFLQLSTQIFRINCQIRAVPGILKGGSG